MRLTNIIKNATEAVAAVPAEERGRGRIHVSAARDGWTSRLYWHTDFEAALAEARAAP